MSRARIAWIGVLAGALLCCLASASMAIDYSREVKDKDYKIWEFDTGDGYSMHLTGFFWGLAEGRRLSLLPPENLNSTIFFNTVDGQPGWAYWFADRHWNVFTADLPGTELAQPPANPDIVKLTEDAVAATYKLGTATQPRAIYAQGLGAAFCIKLRSTTPDAIPAAILVDPIGTKGIQPKISDSPEQVASWDDSLEQHLWVKWGLGPRYGELYPDSDLGEAGFRALMEKYDHNAPPYWATVLTGLQTWMEIKNPKNIAEWPVLLVRGSHPTPEMDAHREAVKSWLSENGASIEEMDLSKEGPAGLSNLPMAGSKADEVAALFMEWLQNLPNNPKFHAPKPQP